MKVQDAGDLRPEARAQLVAETWAAYADTFGVIGWKHHRRGDWPADVPVPGADDLAEQPIG